MRCLRSYVGNLTGSCKKKALQKIQAGTEYEPPMYIHSRVSVIPFLGIFDSRAILSPIRLPRASFVLAPLGPKETETTATQATLRTENLISLRSSCFISLRFKLGWYSVFEFLQAVIHNNPGFRHVRKGTCTVCSDLKCAKFHFPFTSFSFTTDSFLSFSFEARVRAW